MIKIGMLIADRYEVLEKVGTGGMSDVYKAKDHRLNRMVAVKVLKQEFSENANFVSKFRIEAQAAAGLMHPNIVNVYDVGEEKGTYFIIMELVNGITLKQYIAIKGRLAPREAVTVAIQVSMGLAAAHRGHIIHRDIKPQNIIISKEGKVKVTDFGIAKASTSKTITSNVMGSVHYTSPEQARGGFSDEKSDIYSLGVTLYEMLTGSVPYDGDTTVAIALKHIQEPFPSPRDLVPDLPFSIEQIVVKCCEKSPDRRYQTMEELTADLRRSLNDPDGAFVKKAGENSFSETRIMSQKDREEIRRRSSAAGARESSAVRDGSSSREEAFLAGNLAASINPDGSAAVGGAQGSYGSAGGAVQDGGVQGQYDDGQGRPSTGGAPGEQRARSAVRIQEEEAGIDYDDEEEVEEDEKRLDRIIQILSVVAVIVIAAVIILVVLNRRSAGTGREQDGRAGVQEEAQEQTPQEEARAENGYAGGDGAEVEMTLMPQVVGMKQKDAEEALERAGLLYEATYETTRDYAEGIVMNANVRSGATVAKGTSIAITVARLEKVKVPDVTGRSRADAEKALTKLGLVPSAELVYSDDTEKGYVEDQEPEDGRTVSAGDKVTIFVSQGRDVSGMVLVPNLLGMTEQDASAALLRVGLEPGDSIITDTSGRYAPGTVIRQSIEKGEYVDEGTEVNLELSGEPTYSYSARIDGPRHDEDPDYAQGTSVRLVIIGDDGEEYLNTTTSEFPYTVHLKGLECAGGQLYLTYENTIRESIQTGETQDEEPEITEYIIPQEIVRELTFTKE